MLTEKSTNDWSVDSSCRSRGDWHQSRFVFDSFIDGTEVLYTRDKIFPASHDGYPSTWRLEDGGGKGRKGSKPRRYCSRIYNEIYFRGVPFLPLGPFSFEMKTSVSKELCSRLPSRSIFRTFLYADTCFFPREGFSTTREPVGRFATRDIKRAACYLDFLLLVGNVTFQLKTRIWRRQVYIAWEHFFLHSSWLLM